MKGFAHHVRWKSEVKLDVAKTARSVQRDVSVSGALAWA